MAHFCFALRFDASDICFHTSGHTLSSLEVVCFLVSLSPNHENLSGGLSFLKMNLVKPVNASDNSLSPSPVSIEGDRTDFAQEERLGLPHWTMILTTCVVVNECEFLGILTLDFSIILVHLPF